MCIQKNRAFNSIAAILCKAKTHLRVEQKMISEQLFVWKHSIFLIRRINPIFRQLFWNLAKHTKQVQYIVLQQAIINSEGAFQIVAWPGFIAPANFKLCVPSTGGV